MKAILIAVMIAAFIGCASKDTPTKPQETQPMAKIIYVDAALNAEETKVALNIDVYDGQQVFREVDSVETDNVNSKAVYDAIQKAQEKHE